MQEQISITKLSGIDIQTVSNEELVDVSGITLDNNIPQEKRAAFILETVKNPYCFRVGNMGVKLEFSENAPALGELFTAFLTRKKCGL